MSSLTSSTLVTTCLGNSYVRQHPVIFSTFILITALFRSMTVVNSIMDYGKETLLHGECFIPSCTKLDIERAGSVHSYLFHFQLVVVLKLPQTGLQNVLGKTTTTTMLTAIKWRNVTKSQLNYNTTSFHHFLTLVHDFILSDPYVLHLLIAIQVRKHYLKS